MLPFDLHVLSIPPAFNLSHDQTLQFKVLQKYRSTFKSLLDESPTYLKNKSIELIFRVLVTASLLCFNIDTSAHTNCLINLLKNVLVKNSLHSSGRTLYIAPTSCQPFSIIFFNVYFQNLKTLYRTLKSLSGLPELFVRSGAHYKAPQLPVNTFFKTF